MTYFRLLSKAALLALCAQFTVQVTAQPATALTFERSDWQGFAAYPELSVEPAEPGSEYWVEASGNMDVENGTVIYVIMYNHKGRDFVLGAFNCNNRFEVLSSSTNGLYDIECFYKNVFGEIEKTMLRGDKIGAYKQF